LNDVREEWEKISLAYTILSDKKQRLKYDRHSALDNFGSAMAWGIGGLTNGLTTAAKSIINTIEEGQKMSMKIEHSVSEIKVQVRHMEVGQKQRKNDMKSSTSTTNENVKRCKTDAIPASSYGALAHKNFIVPKPKNSKYYSPFEACSIIHEHEKNPALNKPQAMRVMLENEYVPVKRAQLYLLLNKFKEGSLSETREWGRVGRPQNLAP
jgi:curved DNA-binding protein CbpA